MSILIKGMDMPSKIDLDYHDNYILLGGVCYALDIDQLKQIPTPHGRLIDGEKLCYEFIDWQYAEAPDHLNTKEGRMVTDHERQYEVYLALGEAVIEIANAPTILEAEE